MIGWVPYFQLLLELRLITWRMVKRPFGFKSLEEKCSKQMMLGTNDYYSSNRMSVINPPEHHRTG